VDLGEGAGSVTQCKVSVRDCKFVCVEGGKGGQTQCQSHPHPLGGMVVRLAQQSGGDAVWSYMDEVCVCFECGWMCVCVWGVLSGAVRMRWGVCVSVCGSVGYGCVWGEGGGGGV